MAQIYEEVIVIKLSKLVKDGSEVAAISDEQTLQALEQVAQELVGPAIVIEVEKA